MNKDNNIKSGLGDFGRVFKDVKTLWAWMAVAASVPLLANLAGLAPPWPSAIAYLTAIFEILMLIWAYHNFKGAGKIIIGKIINIGIPVLFVLLIGYLYVFSNFTYEIEGTGELGIRGYECTEKALRLYSEECPYIKPDNIKKAEWDPTILWTGDSISVVRTMLVTFWILVFIVLTSILGAFVVRQNDLVDKKNKK